MELSSSLLVVVDVQNGFVTSDTAHAVPTIASLTHRWLHLGGQLAFTRYHNYPGSEVERLMDWRKLYGSPDTDLVEELASYTGTAQVIDKGTYSALTRELLQTIHRSRVTDLIVCGIDSDLCVLATIFEAFDYGLTPWVVTDASASTGGSQAHDAGLSVIARGIGDQQLVDSNTLLAMAAPTREPIERVPTAATDEP